jgi:hypothetical protein
VLSGSCRTNRGHLVFISAALVIFEIQRRRDLAPTDQVTNSEKVS